MAAATITFFPVDCGDMTLVQLADTAGTTLIIDINIRADADDPNTTTRDVAKDLRSRLKRDVRGRPYVDAFLLSHPDCDHIRGLEKHFHLGPLSDYADDKKPDAEKKIVICEIWSSPLVYRRASKNHVLGSDAKAFNKEAKRRVQVNIDKNFLGVAEGDRIQVMGEDQNGKTDKLGPILVKVDATFNRINGTDSKFFSATLLAPLLATDGEEEDELLGKNHSSVILNIKVAADQWQPDGCKFLTAGDAEVVIWERLWSRYKNNTANLQYDLLQAPHHCSWHSLSHDSWSSLREKVKVSADARKALSVARAGASIVASSKPIKDDDKDPPCIRAKTEYVAIVDDVDGRFYCTGEFPNESSPEPLTFTVTAWGLQPPGKKLGPLLAAGLGSSTSAVKPHG
ncbi:MAG: metallohydrolase [Burkholderiales bacterium PBB3]|nr:MAG: metallohydrolase [Burkholderiales bacterium PBB3]